MCIECIDPLLAIKGTERCRFVLFLGIRGYQMPQLYEYFIRIGVLVTNSPSSIKIRLLRQLSQQTRYGTFFLGHPVGLDITVVNIASPTVPVQRGRREKSNYQTCIVPVFSCASPARTRPAREPTRAGTPWVEREQ